MKWIYRWLAGLALLALFIANFSHSTAAQAVEWQSKVDPWVISTVRQGEAEFLVLLSTQADLSQAGSLPTKLEKGTYVYKTLSETAARTQAPLLRALRATGAAYQSFWVANMVWVRGDVSVLQTVAQRSDVAHVYANPTVHLDELPAEAPSSGGEAPDAIEWNINIVNAPQVWNAGYNGQGAVIGGQDTGYDWDHPALVNQYRGSGPFANHNYNWHDAIHNGGGICGANSPFPCDDHGHGTHTMGTMVGDDGGSNQIGMAPGARWIGCRNMDQGNGTPATYSECYQWFIAPTDLANLNPRPDLAPDVINNSWGCPPSEGCTDPNVLLLVVNNVRAAGILTAHSAGNSGSSCSTVNEPAAIYDASFTVGSTTSTNTISSFSSRGPVTVDGSGRMKPDISAPGSSVRSSYPGGGYSIMSGTSMAGPHVAGLVGLLVSIDPLLKGQVDLLETIITQSAVPVTVNQLQICGGIPSSTIPNNTFGWGRIDAWGAYQYIQSNQHTLQLAKQASPAQVEPGGMLDYTLTVTHTHYTSPTAHVVLTDVLPTGTSFVTATSPYTLTGNVITWGFPSLAANETRSIGLTVQVADGASGMVLNDQYSVASDDVSPVTGAPVSTPIRPYELQIGKAGPTATMPGEVLTYTLSVTNPMSYADQHNLVITDTLPDQTIFIGASPGYTIAGDTVAWAFPDLAPGASQTVQIAVRADSTAAYSIINTAYGAQTDEASISGIPIQTQVIRYDLLVSKQAPAVVAPGGLLTYTLNVSNPPASFLQHHLVITDLLPVETSFVTATLPFTKTGDLITWQALSLPTSATWEVDLVVRVPLTFTGTIVNEHYATFSDEAAPVGGAPAQTQILGLAISKIASTDLILPGSWITYTLTVTNQHPLSATHLVVLTDRLPAETSLITASLPYTLSDDVISWQIASLGPGESWRQQVVVKVDERAKGPIANFDYAVHSMEVPTPVFGAPTLTTVLKRFYFTTILR